MSEDRLKLVFLLHPTGGWPPVTSESVWARRRPGGVFEIENIPFFVKRVSCGDLVAARLEGDEHVFVGLVESRRHTTVRVICRDAGDIPELRRKLRELDCESELATALNLFALDVPPEVDYRAVLSVLAPGLGDRWDLEESALRH